MNRQTLGEIMDLEDRAEIEYSRLVSQHASWDEDLLWKTAYARAEDYLIGLADAKHDEAIDNLVMEKSNGNDE